MDLAYIKKIKLSWWTRKLRSLVIKIFLTTIFRSRTYRNTNSKEELQSTIQILDDLSTQYTPLYEHKLFVIKPHVLKLKINELKLTLIDYYQQL